MRALRDWRLGHCRKEDRQGLFDVYTAIICRLGGSVCVCVCVCVCVDM